MSTVHPTVDGLPAPLREAAVRIATRLRDAGDRGWIVGGAVRDLALGREPHDVDMACRSRPEEIEALFASTHAVGRAFGTVVVPTEGVDVQLTTFRKDGAYRDGRRPESVEFGDSLEEDATRRDFTANALYLDPLTGDVSDPTGGLDDLARGHLRCVGNPRERLAEDRLRFLRLARFAARYALEIDEETRRAAAELAAQGPALTGVSAERILAELCALFDGPGSALAMEIVAGLRILDGALPAWEGSGLEVRTELFAELPDPPGAALGLCALVAPDRGAALERVRAAIATGVGALRPSRALLRAVDAVAAAAERVESALTRTPESDGHRANLVRLARSEARLQGLALARARRVSEGRDREPVLELARKLERIARESDLHPEPLLTSADVADAGVPAGPRWGKLLAAAEELQLDGKLASRDDALAWLRARAAE